MLSLIALSTLALPNLLECDRDLELGREVMQAAIEKARANVKLSFDGRDCGTGFFSPGENLTLTASNVPSGAMGLLELAPGGAQFNMRGATCEKLRLQVDLRRADRTPKIQIQAPSDSKSLLKVRMAYARGLGNVYLTGWCTLTPAVLGQMPASAQRATAPSPPSPPPPPPRFGTAPLVEAHRAGAPLVSPTVLRTGSVTADALGGDRCPRNVHCTLVVNLTLGLVRFKGPDGLEAGMYSYSSSGLVGPTIRVTPNTTLVVRLTNNAAKHATGAAGADLIPPRLPPHLAGTKDAANALAKASAAMADASPYSTNLHLHAIHASPNAPGDDYTARVPPGQTRTYIYRISPDHQGGTHFYHPHLHGTTATQLGGAALGALIIEEAPGQLPEEVQALDELPILVLTHVDMPRLVQAAMLQETTCIDTLTKTLTSLFAPPEDEEEEDDDDDDRLQASTQRMTTRSAAAAASEAAAEAAEVAAEAACRDEVWSLGPISGQPVSAVLVNGQLQPTIKMEAGTWYRARLIFSSLNAILLPQLPSPACETMLLAKDGLPLRAAPRKISHAVLGPGSRADLLLRCVAGRHSLFSAGSMNTTAFGADTEGRPRAWTDGPGVIQTPTLLTLIVGEGTEAHGTQPSAGDPAGSRVVADELRSRSRQLDTAANAVVGGACASLPTFAVARPCYLADLRNTPPAAVLNFGMGPQIEGALINGRAYGSPGLTPTFRAGSVVEVRLGGAEAHPFHSHVNVFQLQQTPLDTTNSGGYLEAGDWQDTLIAPRSPSLPEAETMTNSPPGWTRVRMQTDRYVGPQLLHCHNLEHSDRGQMMRTQIEGNEGDEWPGAQAVEPSCYRAGDSVPKPIILTPASSCSAKAESCDASRRSHLRGLVACSLARVWRAGVIASALEPPTDGLWLPNAIAALLLLAALCLAGLLGRHRSCFNVGTACERERRSLLRFSVVLERGYED